MKRILIVTLLALLASCDCLYHASGQIIDETGTGISGVRILTISSEREKATTDSTGAFLINMVTGFTCGSKEFRLLKEGYETLEIEIDCCEEQSIEMKAAK